MSKVLIVEDDRNYREILAKVLAKEGIEGMGGEDGQRAVDILLEKDVDLIILDLLMPNMDGVNFYYHLKNTIKKDIPVVILTNLIEAPYPSGVKDFIIKANVSLAELVGKIKLHLSQVNYTKKS